MHLIPIDNKNLTVHQNTNNHNHPPINDSKNTNHALHRTINTQNSNNTNESLHDLFFGNPFSEPSNNAQHNNSYKLNTENNYIHPSNLSRLLLGDPFSGKIQNQPTNSKSSEQRTHKHRTHEHRTHEHRTHKQSSATYKNNTAIQPPILSHRIENTSTNISNKNKFASSEHAYAQINRAYAQMIRHVNNLKDAQTTDSVNKPHTHCPSSVHTKSSVNITDENAKRAFEDMIKYTQNLLRNKIYKANPSNTRRVLGLKDRLVSITNLNSMLASNPKIFNDIVTYIRLNENLDDRSLLNAISYQEKNARIYKDIEVGEILKKAINTLELYRGK